jgi:hypothetical protein
MNGGRKKNQLSASWAARFLHCAYIAVFRGEKEKDGSQCLVEI